MKKHLFKQIVSKEGFTIVELLIVVVVISILAAITIVSYNGIAQSASDSARVAESASIEKKLRMKEVESSTIITVPRPSSRANFYAYYGLESLASAIYHVDYASTGYENFYSPNKTKIYMGLRYENASIPAHPGNHIWWSYWSNKDSQWIQKEMSGNGIITTTLVGMPPIPM